MLFIFDPQRRAVFLVGGDKAGKWSEWYKTAIPQAEQAYAEHSFPPRSPDPPHLGVLDTSRLCQGCSRPPRHQPDQAAPASATCRDKPPAKVSHLHTDTQHLTAHHHPLTDDQDLRPPPTNRSTADQPIQVGTVSVDSVPDLGRPLSPQAHA
jgi:hypothetical protein